MMDNTAIGLAIKPPAIHKKTAPFGGRFYLPKNTGTPAQSLSHGWNDKALILGGTTGPT